MVRQDPKEAAVCFFFKHYTGTVHDHQTNNGFSLLWQPLYLRSAVSSPLRLATAAVTVNVAMMWCFKGCDARPARKLFTQAISALRQAINAPSQREMDELLMTILIFDLYDALVLHYVPGPPSYGKHKKGAMALIKHRGLSNYATELSRGLITATRHSLIQYSLATRKLLPAGSEECFNHPSVSNSKSTVLDQITIGITKVQNRLWTLRREYSSARTPDDRRQAYEELVFDAINIDDLLMTWKRSASSEPLWIPTYVSREEVAPSILSAGFYGSRCALWVDFSYADVSVYFPYVWCRCLGLPMCLRHWFG